MVDIDTESLAPGRQFELEVSGVTLGNNDRYLEAEEVPLEEAIHEIITTDIVHQHTREVTYDPARPSMGLLPELFAQVKKHLKKTGRVTPYTLRFLRLYNAIGTRADFFYKIDLLFTLKDAKFMIDITLREGKLTPWTLLTLSDVENKFESLAQKVADKLARDYTNLKRRKDFYKQKNRKRLQRQSEDEY